MATFDRIPNGTRVMAYAVAYHPSERHPVWGVVEAWNGLTYAVRLDKPWHGQALGYFDLDRVRPLNALERLAEES
jgi:hypothetical protein